MTPKIGTLIFIMCVIVNKQLIEILLTLNIQIFLLPRVTLTVTAVFWQNMENPYWAFHQQEDPPCLSQFSK